ncbi:MAG: TonB-dependent receptor [Desulfatitalea sp.]|nr:TonB-dependent receptor [Desulfatitalea sp.]NNK01040.1 TonB-dependent receptor [Desulfatitalea sp.]
MLEKLLQRLLAIFGIVLFILPGSADARDGHGQMASETMADMVVTAERIQDYIQKHPNLVEQVSREEIKGRNILSVQEALHSLPGVDVKESTGLGARISIRGSGKSGGVLVLLNGRPLNSSQYGSADLSGIPIELVESITVFKPPVPVWLGPGGSEGAINIITRAPTDHQSPRHWTQLRANGGSYGLAEGAVSYRLLAGADTYSATAGVKHRDGKRANSDRDSGRITLHWGRKYSERQQVNVDGRYYASDHGSSGPNDNPTPDARQTYSKGSLDGRMEGLIGESWDYTFNLYVDHTDLEDRSQSGFISNLNNTKWGAKGECAWSDEDNIWEMRLNAIAEQNDVDHTLSGVHHRTITGIGTQAYRHFSRFTTTLGIRVDHTSDFDTHPGVSAGVSVRIVEGWTAKLNTGYRVEIPTFGQLYQPSHGSIDQVRGNPDLSEEQIFSYDVGIEYRRGKTHLFQLSVFRSDTMDPIVYLRRADLVYQPGNAEDAFRQGVEATAKYAWKSGLALDLNAVFQASELKYAPAPAIGSAGKDLPYTPAYTLKAALQYALPPRGIRLEAGVRHCAEQYSEATNDETQRLDAYTTVDLKAIQPFKIKSVSVEWFVTIQNLFDEGFEVHYGYPDDGIRFVTGLNVTL